MFALRRFDRDVGLVLAAFVVLLAVENVVIGIGYRAEFAGTWEMGSARLHLSPIALAAMVPVAVLLAALARTPARVVGLAGLGGGAALGWGVSTGRRMANLAVRAPFVAFVALAVGLVAWQVALRAPRVRPGRLALAGVVVGSAAWLADALVLPRLYPAFHLGLAVIALAGWAALAVPLAAWGGAGNLAFAAIAVAGLSIAWTPLAAKKTAGQDNLRRILLEHAPVLGRSVVVASRIAPPPPLEDDAAAATTLTSLRDRRGRTLDWSGHDIVVITVDALRADHVSSYGYGRPTTPAIDALAANGARFEHAYCPTPHTSYSIASMMTGKYMKPLLALGGGDGESETWPVQLRRYGYRTAAFYPPAVFFIDEHRFRRMRDDNLGFEYRKEEFTRPELRRSQIERYLDTEAPRDKPLFLWVHLFEPHEPYEMHPEHPFSGDPRLDAYDSEVAAADAFVGDLVRMIGAKRPPGTVFVISADHGEEHDDHGGRYHGTTVYEEQVRVPLVIVGPGIEPHVVSPPVQTIDLLPTTLAALDVPIPPRLRGRDLGALLTGKEGASFEGLAFAETDDYTLVARGTDRLVCARKVGSCTLFDVAKDPAEKHPIGDRPERVAELRKLTAAIERETGKVESRDLPEALRRGLQGDRSVDAAEDVAQLLDDARPDIRRLAAKCTARLHVPETTAQLRRAHARDEDAIVRTWTGLALARLGDPVDVAPLLEASDVETRTMAALVLAEHGDARGERHLVQRWTTAFGAAATSPGELDEARELLAAFGKLRAKSAVPGLVRSLDDVRLRADVVETLGAIGDARAREPLLRVFEEERYLNLRPIEARALVALGTREPLLGPLARFAGMPEPLTEALPIAAELDLLTPARGGAKNAERARPRLVTTGPARLLVLAGASGTVAGTVGGAPLPPAEKKGDVFVVDLGERRAGEIELRFSPPVRALWLVPKGTELPPPAPRAWDAGAP